MNKIVISVGAGVSQMPYLQQVKQLGFQIICIDMSSDSPGFSLADRHLVASTYDSEAALSWVNQLGLSDEQVAGVIAPCTGPPYRTMNALKKYFGLQATSEDNVDLLLDKYKLRQKLNELGCSSIKIYNDQKKLTKRDFPLIMKPRWGGMGGMGVELFENENELPETINSFLIEPSYVYEQYIPGKEIALDAIWNGKELVFLSLGWTLFDENSIIGSASISDHELNAQREMIKKLLSLLCNELALGPEVINADVILTDEGELHFIEIEFVPADIIWQAEACYGYDMVKNYIAAHLGKGIDVQADLKLQGGVALNTKVTAENPEDLLIELRKISPAISFYRNKNE